MGINFKSRDPGKSKNGIAHKEQYRNFVKAILEDREPVVNGDEGKRALEIILAVYQSAKEGKEISLPLQE